jgi:protein phosphatase
MPPGQGEVTDMMDVVSQGEPPEAERPRHWWARRRLVIPLVALIVLAGALSGLYAWTQTQYFVSAAGGRVVIFKGVNVSLAGAHLYHPVHTSDLSVADLITPARQRVKDGLSADSRSSAEDIITNLGDNELLPLCAPPKPSPTPTPSPSPSRPATSHSAPDRPPAHHSAARPTPTPTARSTASHRPAVDHASPRNPISASRSASPSVAVPSGPVPVPGKDCR